MVLCTGAAYEGKFSDPLSVTVAFVSKQDKTITFDKIIMMLSHTSNLRNIQALVVK